MLIKGKQAEPAEAIPIRPVRRMAAKALAGVAASWRAANQLKKPQPKRILVVDPVGLGDIVTCEPLIRELLAAEKEVVICSKAVFKTLFPEHNLLHWAPLHLPFGSPDEKAKYAFKYYYSDPFRSDILNLRKVAGGATALDLRGDIRCVLLLYAVGCRRVISLSNYLGSNLHMSPAAAEIVPFQNGIRRWELNLKFLEELVARAPIQSSRPRFAHLIDRKETRRVCFMPIAPWPGKFWQKERWIDLAASFRERGFTVEVLCGPNQRAETRALVGGALDIVECGSVERWISELNNCRCLITVDSGPMHLADALDVPLVALFGQGKLPLWAPSAARSRFIHHQDDPDFSICQPIFQNIPLGQKFMNRITVDEVMKAVDEIAAGVPAD